MSLDPMGMTQGNYWNYSNPNKEGYSTQLVGTVLAIQEVQAMSYNPGGPRQPQFWPDGNPKMNIRLALADDKGELKLFTFQPAGKAARQGLKPSIHMSLFALTNNTGMKKLIGQTIMIATREGSYGANNPRPWEVAIVDAGPFSLSIGELPEEYKVPRVLANEGAHGGQTMGMPQQPMMQQPMPAYPQQMQQPAYQPQQPMYPQQPQAMPRNQYQPQMQQPAMQPQASQGMDPAVMAAMQQMGATNVQQVQQAAPVQGIAYDDIPF